MKRKGVCYEVRRVLDGSLQRSNCEAPKDGSADALKQGLEVWFSPEMLEKSQEETFDYLVRAANVDESLRAKYPKLLRSPD